MLEHGIWGNVSVFLDHGHTKWLQNELAIIPFNMRAVVFAERTSTHFDLVQITKFSSLQCLPIVLSRIVGYASHP